MSAASARQSQRVLIDAPVRLTLREASRSLPARALDLSEGGMRLSAEAPLSVGDEVTCNLELDNERAVLEGCVRWSKPAALSGSGAGVQFAALNDDQLALLRRWLAHNSQHAQTVLLHLPNMREPLRARGCVTADGLQLTASLPQLAPGVELEFQLGESGSRRVGRIERVDEPQVAGAERVEVAGVEPHRQLEQAGGLVDHVVAREVLRVVECARRRLTRLLPQRGRVAAGGAEATGTQARDDLEAFVLSL